MSAASPAPTTAPSTQAMNEYRRLVAAWIADNRRALKLSAEQIGVALDRSSSTIRNWENGVGNITLFDALALHGYFTAKWSEFGKRHIVTPEEMAVRDLPLPAVPASREA